MSTTMFTNHYDILGVSRHASIKEISISWKRFALKYHPDKTNCVETATEVFRKGLEAIEILRDPDRRSEYDKGLKAHSSHPQATSTGWDHRPPRTSSAYYGSMNSHYRHSYGPANWSEHQNRQNGANYGDNFDGPSGKYRSEAEMDMIFERVKRRERARLAAEKQRQTQGAQAYPETFQQEGEPTMHPWVHGSYSDAHFEARKPRPSPYKEEISAQTRRDVQNPTARFDKASGGDSLEHESGTYPNDDGVISEASTFSHKSTDYVSVNSGLRDSSDFNRQLWSAGSSYGSDDNLSQPGGVRLADFETLNDDEETYSSDTLRCSLPASNCDLATTSSSLNSMSPGQPARGRDNPVNSDESQWPLRQFIPYVKAKLNDPCGRYTVNDMCEELHGLVMESVYSWLETTRLADSIPSPTAAGDVSACQHLGVWHQKFGYPECGNCHLWKPLYTLTCPGCGLKKCVRCKSGACL